MASVGDRALRPMSRNLRSPALRAVANRTRTKRRRASSVGDVLRPRSILRRRGGQKKKRKMNRSCYVPVIQFNGRHESCSLNRIAFTFVANTVTDRRPDKRHRTSRRGVFHSYERLFNRTFRKTPREANTRRLRPLQCLATQRRLPKRGHRP